MDFWNTNNTLPPQPVVNADGTHNPLSDLPAEVVQEHLGKHSTFVGLMDDAEKVQAHLDAVHQYQAVRQNLLAPGEGRPALNPEIAHDRTAMDEALATGVPSNPLAEALNAIAAMPPPVDADDIPKAVRVERARQAWKDAVERKRVALLALDSDVRRLHAEFTRIKNT